MVGQETRMTAAEECARRNWQRNLFALEKRQASLARELRGVSTDVEWMFGRDASLTARDNGRWWSGSSLPRRTAQRILQKMELKAGVGCFLCPTHAQQIRVALDTLTAAQALIVVLPCRRELRIALECECFEQDMLGGRLWFAGGEDWANDLADLLQHNEGLPVPGQIIRTHLVDAQVIEPLTAQANQVFAQENQRRAARIASIFANTHRPAESRQVVAVIAPSMFRLWDDGGQVLGRLAKAHGWSVLDSDDPASASGVALARCAGACNAVVACNLGRRDLPGALPAELAMVTWLTAPRIPAFDAACGRDLLLVADRRWRDAAISAGWPQQRVALAGWPAERRERHGDGLVVIADTCNLEPPEFDLSSHRLLWENIAAELTADPAILGEEISNYLTMWLDRSGVAEETIDRRLFVERLITPAYQQGLVRRMMQARLPLKLHGRGWQEIPEMRGAACGEVNTRSALRQALDGAGALVHVWPSDWAHPIDSAGLPILRPRGLRAQQWLKAAAALAGGSAVAASTEIPPLTGELIRDALSM